MKILTFLAVFSMYCSSIYSQSISVNIDDLKSLEGNWRGTIEYYDAKKAKENLVLQTELICKVKNDILIMNFKYYDQNGEFTRKTERLAISDNGTSIKDNVVWHVLKMDKNGLNGNIVLAMKSEIIEDATTMRKTITIRDGKLSIMKDEVLGDDGQTNSLYSFNFEKLNHKLYR